MEGGDVFSDVSFADVTLNLSGGAVDNGGKGDTPPVAKEGAKADSPPAGANKPADSPPVDVDKGKKPGEGEKPLPYDQDPKWKSARAAEKALTDLKTKFGFKTDDELAKALEHGTGLKTKVGEKDVDQLLADAAELAKLREKQDAAAEVEKRKGETPEQTIQRLERRIAAKEREFQTKEEARANAEKSAKVVKAYDNMVLDEVRAIQDELPGGTKQLIAHLLGVQNPVNDIEIEDITTARTVTKSTIQKVVNFIKGVQQRTIDDYAAGKSKLTATQPKPVNDAGAKPAPGADDKGSPKPGENAGKSVDEVFGGAAQEFARVMLQAGAVP